MEVAEATLRTAEEERPLHVADIAVDRVGEAVGLEVAVAARLERVEHQDDLAALDCSVVHGAQARRALPTPFDAPTDALRAVAAQKRDRDDRERRCRGACG